MLLWIPVHSRGGDGTGNGPSLISSESQLPPGVVLFITAGPCPRVGGLGKTLPRRTGRLSAWNC